MEQDDSLAGNAFVAHRGDRLRRLRPDWVEIIAGSDDDDADSLDAEVLGYLYHPGGKTTGRGNGKFLLPGEVAHFAPIPDPEAHYRGMSWLTPIAREVDADTAMNVHKGKFFDHAATPNMLVKVQQTLEDKAFERLQAQINLRHEGTGNAWRTMLLEGGADATVVGHNFQEMAFKTVQGAGETRIAAAAGVPPIVVGLSEGLDSATYSNYGQARRRFADMTIRPLWRDAAGSLATVLEVPSDSELWYDDRDITALQDDAKDAAEIQRQHAVTMAQLILAGYEPATVTAAVTAGDLTVLTHTGRVPVQLQTPGSEEAAESAAARNLVEMIQKGYLGVGTVVTTEEARDLLNKAGGELDGPGPTSPTD
jgi:phage portal protein BeeE